MKKLVIILSLFTGLNICAQDTLKGPHGGELFRGRRYNIEKLSIGNKLYAYLYDMYMLPVSNKQIEAKLELFYPGASMCQLKLDPCEENSFCVETGLQAYSYCVIYFNTGSEVAWAKFYNYYMVARRIVPGNKVLSGN